ncbi:MAG TPA: gamma-glutamyl-gamma-aminobutyrate hydrolase family protein [Planctomycetota bacterium]|nr:gamma-glutamyl-gamma-aminobutyrate hydrolase family protein [Planctomycetota bacterium]
MRPAGRILVGGTLLLGTLGVAPSGVALWAAYGAPRTAPRIGLSISDVWYDASGVNPAPYAAAIARAGGSVRFLTPLEDPGRALEGLDGIVLAGSHEDVDPSLFGGDPRGATGVNRARDDFEIALLGQAEARRLPVLGICRGAQLVAVAHGGTLRRLPPEPAGRHGVGISSLWAHEVRIDPESRLAGLSGREPFRVSSTHLQAIVDPGPRLRTAARADDGVIEAVELPGPRLVLGVQWHPELDSLARPEALAPFRLLVAAARGPL